MVQFSIKLKLKLNLALILNIAEFKIFILIFYIKFSIKIIN